MESDVVKALGILVADLWAGVRAHRQALRAQVVELANLCEDSNATAATVLQQQAVVSRMADDLRRMVEGIDFVESLRGLDGADAFRTLVSQALSYRQHRCLP